MVQRPEVVQGPDLGRGAPDLRVGDDPLEGLLRLLRVAGPLADLGHDDAHLVGDIAQPGLFRQGDRLVAGARRLVIATPVGQGLGVRGEQAGAHPVVSPRPRSPRASFVTARVSRGFSVSRAVVATAPSSSARAAGSAVRGRWPSRSCSSSSAL